MSGAGLVPGVGFRPDQSLCTAAPPSPGCIQLLGALFVFKFIPHVIARSLVQFLKKSIIYEGCRSIRSPVSDWNF